MPRIRVWDLSKLPEAIQQSECWADVCRLLGRPSGGTAQATVLRWATKLELDSSHFSKSIGWERGVGRFGKENRTPNTELFCENSTVSRSRIRDRLLNDELIEYRCQFCGSDGTWFNVKISLEIDHINGVSNDHRLENLRWLCPNCHATTITYAGKNKCIVKPPNPGVVNPTWRNDPRPKNRKVKWPTKDELRNLISEIGNWRELGRRFGVSDNAVKKWAKNYGLIRGSAV